MDDLINRQDAINAIKSMMTNLKYGKSEREALDDAQNLMYHMPSAQPTARVWLEDSKGNLICSKCKFKFYPIMFNFCPNCGADMRGKICQEK